MVPFWGPVFTKKRKKGVPEKSSKSVPKNLQNVSETGGGYLIFLGAFFTSEPCSDPLCCWNAPGPRFFTILASLFLHFCVAARYQEQLFLPSPPKLGGGQKAPILGGELLGSTFLLQLTRKHSLVGPPPPKLGGEFHIFCCCLCMSF